MKRRERETNKGFSLLIAENLIIRISKRIDTCIDFSIFSTNGMKDTVWPNILEGKIDLIINCEKRTYTKGDRYHMPAGIKHSTKIYAGYADIMVLCSQTDTAL